jgi:hypothetical protein
MLRKALSMTILSLSVGLELSDSQIAMAQDNPAGGSRAPSLNEAPLPSSQPKADPDRLPTDVDAIVCKALKAEYDKCAPACGERCEALYGEARLCLNVDRRCNK